MTKSDFTCASLQVRNMNFVDARLFSEIDLPPAALLSQIPDSFAKLDANIRGHSSSIDLVEALYLVDALSRRIPRQSEFSVSVSSHGDRITESRSRHHGGSEKVRPRQNSMNFNWDTDCGASL